MIILFGAAGSGKSTQGREIAECYGWKWLSVGEVLRQSGQFHDTLKNGELVDDKKVIEMMKKEMEKADENGMNVVLDGYPRDVEQAKWMVSEMPEKIEAAIVLKVPKEELLKRIEARGRNDDVAEVIEKRIKIFEDNIVEILPLFHGEDIPVFEVDGVGEMDEVTGRIMKVVEVAVPDAVVQIDDVNNGDVEKSYGE